MRVDQERPRRRDSRPFDHILAKNCSVGSCHWWLRRAAKHELAARAGHEYVLAEQSALHRLGRDQFAQTEPIERLLQLPVADHAKAFRVSQRGHRRKSAILVQRSIGQKSPGSGSV